MKQTGKEVEDQYKKIYDNINRFSPTRSITKPDKITGDPGRDDFKQIKAQEKAFAENIVEENLAKARRKAAAQLAVGIKPSAKAGEPGEDTGDKIAECMKKASEAAQEVKEKIE